MQNNTSPELIDQLNDIAQSEEPIKRLIFYFGAELTRRELRGEMDPLARLSWCALNLLQGNQTPEIIAMLKVDILEIQAEISK